MTLPATRVPRAPRPIPKRALAKLVYVSGMGGPYIVHTSGLTPRDIEAHDYRQALFLMHALRRYVTDVLRPEEQRGAFPAFWLRQVGLKP